MYVLEENGLTLLEVMISLIILTFGILGLAPLLVLSIDANSCSKDVLVASSIVRDKIEYLESLDSIPSSAYSEYESDVQVGYSRTTIIQDHSSNSSIPEGLLRATVRADWIDKTGIGQQVSVSAYLEKSKS